MQYKNIKKVSYYQTLTSERYDFAIGQNDNWYYAIIINENNIIIEKAINVAIAKQILLNNFYKYIHKDTQENKYNNDTLKSIELMKKIKTKEIINYIY